MQREEGLGIGLRVAGAPGEPGRVFGGGDGPGHLAGLERVVQRAGQRRVHPRGQGRWFVAEGLGGGGEQRGVAVPLG